MLAKLHLMTMDTAEPRDDRQLVDASRSGDSLAFEELVRRKSGKVFGLCCRILGNREDAKDVAQLAFVKLWENLDKYDAGYAFDTWLYRITSNVAIDFIRGRQSRDATLNSSLRLVKTSDDPEQGRAIQHKEVEAVFEEVSKALSPKQKTIFAMHAMEDLQLAEIARILGTKESTVRNHLFNARKTMQKELRRRFPEYARLWKENEA